MQDPFSAVPAAPVPSAIATASSSSSSKHTTTTITTTAASSSSSSSGSHTTTTTASGSSSSSSSRSSGKKHEIHNPLEHVNVAGARAAPDYRITIRANSTRLKRSGDWFAVEWAGVPGPDYGDWVALYPAAADRLWSVAPLKFQIAARAPAHLQHGSGKLRFRLINYRQAVVFAFVRGGFLSPRIVATSEPVRISNPNEPLQGRLALTGGGPTEMLVQWSTHNSSRPVVQWGRRPGRLHSETPATSHTYTKDEMCGPPANTVGWIDPGLIHVAKLEGLKPGHRYYYRFGDEQWGFSKVWSFRAAPPAGPEGAPLRFLAVADLGQSEADGTMEPTYYAASLNTTRLLGAELERHDYSLLLHNGDISYARGYVSQWDNFHHQLEPVVARIPYMVAPGNHERNWPRTGDRFNGRAAVYDSGGECGVPYERRMAMPIAGADQPWYAFTLGPVRFVQYSTEHPLTPGSDQHCFITTELERVNRSLTPWVVVSGHRPLYVSSTNNWWPDGDQPAAEEARGALEQLMLDHGVDLTLHGHHHSYQRTCPVFRGKCQGYAADGTAKAPVHVVIGNAGAPLSTNVPLQPAPIWETIKMWWGYLRIEVTPTQLSAEAVSDADGKAMDAFVLNKPRGWGDAFMKAKQRRRQ